MRAQAGMLLVRTRADLKQLKHKSLRTRYIISCSSVYVCLSCLFQKRQIPQAQWCPQALMRSITPQLERATSKLSLADVHPEYVGSCGMAANILRNRTAIACRLTTLKWRFELKSKAFLFNPSNLCYD
eukprot:1138185-Pelagomonas_calceolata.AAC.4